MPILGNENNHQALYSHSKCLSGGGLDNAQTSEAACEVNKQDMKRKHDYKQGAGLES